MSDAGDNTYPMQCSGLRKGGFVMLKGKPCKIVEYSTSKPGKHGHAKAHVIGIDLLTQKKVEDVFPTSHRVTVPEVKREEYTVVGIGPDGTFALMNDTGDVRRDLSISKMCDKPLEKIQQMYDEMMEDDDAQKATLLAQVMDIAGAHIVKDFKFGK